MKTGEDGCASKTPLRPIRVEGDADPAVRRRLEGLVSLKLEARERADRATTWTPAEYIEDVRPEVREAYASLLFNLMMARRSLEVAEGALEKAKKLITPEQATQVRRLALLSWEASNEALAELGPKTGVESSVES